MKGRSPCTTAKAGRSTRRVLAECSISTNDVIEALAAGGGNTLWTVAKSRQQQRRDNQHGHFAATFIQSFLLPALFADKFSSLRFHR
ncbi:hypothetical protein AHF37_09317 [Paragonimus kellicotti]|nr:hypothetical protein AHF37_09317 [Paragonimus kellicotti]